MKHKFNEQMCWRMLTAFFFYNIIIIQSRYAKWQIDKKINNESAFFDYIVCEYEHKHINILLHFEYFHLLYVYVYDELWIHYRLHTNTRITAKKYQTNISFSFWWQLLWFFFHSSKVKLFSSCEVYLFVGIRKWTSCNVRLYVKWIMNMIFKTSRSKFHP